MNLRLPPGLERVLRPPSWPGTVAPEKPTSKTGVDYDTSWTRTRPARLARAMIVDNVTRPLTRLVTTPTIYGIEHLEALHGPAIFAANHTSHLDTAVILSSLPVRYRHHTVVAAAADYFFDRHWKAALWSFSLGTIPMERTKVNRKSADLAAELIADGWSLVIFPEGGRSPDGWGQEFRGGAAYLAKRCGVPVVPIHLRGVRPIFPKGRGTLRPGKVDVRFGDPLRPMTRDENNGREEDARRFAARVEAGVAMLADEAETDWWTARQRAAQHATPAFRGPQSGTWRRTWELPESQRLARKDSASKRAKPW